MQPYSLKDRLGYDANRPLRNCIMTRGGVSDVHPDGGRSFNLQELACLAGFPQSYIFPFYQTHGQLGRIRKLIGNAVPPPVAKAMFKQVIKTMQETDRQRAELRAQVIELD